RAGSPEMARDPRADHLDGGCADAVLRRGCRGLEHLVYVDVPRAQGSRPMTWPIRRPRWSDIIGTPTQLMTLTEGSRRGPYEIIGYVRSGAMGHVYRARDTRLERSVAIKVLRDEVSGRERLRARFEREGQAISRLSHPNICVLYDVGHHDGVDFLVMEYL